MNIYMYIYKYIYDLSISTIGVGIRKPDKECSFYECTYNITDDSMTQADYYLVMDSCVIQKCCICYNIN